MTPGIELSRHRFGLQHDFLRRKREGHAEGHGLA